MNIPKIVRIGSMDYEVKKSNSVILKGNMQCYGHIDFDRHTIEIDTSLQDSQGLEHTFLHEVIHGIFKERNIDLKKSDDEEITDEIALGLHQIIKDNPDIF